MIFHLDCCKLHPLNVLCLWYFESVKKGEDTREFMKLMAIV